VEDALARFSPNNRKGDDAVTLPPFAWRGFLVLKEVAATGSQKFFILCV